MRYYFVRHGIAEDFAGSDFARELTARGRRRVAASAKVMKRLGIRPARIYSSPRLRASQTAEIIAAELGMDITLAEEVNFGFAPGDVAALSQPLSAGAEVMFVGHNPDMSLMIQRLTGVSAAMKKGGLARVDGSYELMHCELVWLIAPKVFDALQDSAPNPSDLSSALSDKPAATDSALHDLIQRRWSPLGFDRERSIERTALMSILEAGRWAASSYNLQPWRFIVARRQEAAEFQKMLSVLKEGNQTWAQHAAALMIGVIEEAPEGRANRHASHDLGQALAQMVLQALDQRIYAHQMGGFFPEKARAVYKIPAGYTPFTALALGYRSRDLSHLSAAHRQREAAVRQRQPLHEMIYQGAWAQSAGFLESD